MGNRNTPALVGPPSIYHFSATCIRFVLKAIIHDYYFLCVVSEVFELALNLLSKCGI